MLQWGRGANPSWSQPAAAPGLVGSLIFPDERPQERGRELLPRHTVMWLCGAGGLVALEESQHSFQGTHGRAVLHRQPRTSPGGPPHSPWLCPGTNRAWSSPSRLSEPPLTRGLCVVAAPTLAGLSQDSAALWDSSCPILPVPGPPPALFPCQCLP